MHDIYVRITYQILVDERKQILMEQQGEERIARDSAKNGDGGGGHINGGDDERERGGDDDRESGLWQSRKSVVNSLKSTISMKDTAAESVKDEQM